MAETALRLRISGKVQNVRFCGWLVELASGAGLRGWVRNRSDGAVEALLIGPESYVREVGRPLPIRASCRGRRQGRGRAGAR